MEGHDGDYGGGGELWMTEGLIWGGAVIVG
jgi:hypothetical protein